jgi:small subunit ribosomal protein S6
MCSFPASILLDNLGINYPQSQKEKKMALYESVIIGRQDLTPGQFETLLEKFIAVIQSFKGKIKKRENWGIRNLAYKINKNRKGHYMLLNIDGPPEAIQEYERLMRLDEDIIRFLTIKIKSIDEKPSPLMVNKSDRSKNETLTDDNLSVSDNE